MSDVQLIGMAFGSVVGLILALTGAGGAILSVPLLVFGLHMTVAHAGPIGLLAVAVSAGISTVLGLKENMVRYKAAGLMAGCGLLLSPFGLWMAQRVPNRPLIIILAAVLIHVALRMWKRASCNDTFDVAEVQNAPPCRVNLSTGKFNWTVPCARSLMFAGGLAGFFSGLLGVGGGFIVVPSLKKRTDLAMRSIIETSLCVLTIVSIGGVIVANANGNMDWYIALPFSAGSIAGMLVGRIIAGRIAGAQLQRSFAVLVMVTAGAMLIKAFDFF